jgi:hypothetical protein
MAQEELRRRGPLRVVRTMPRGDPGDGQGRSRAVGESRVLLRSRYDPSADDEPGGARRRGDAEGDGSARQGLSALRDADRHPVDQARERDREAGGGQHGNRHAEKDRRPEDVSENAAPEAHHRDTQSKAHSRHMRDNRPEPYPPPE